MRTKNILSLASVMMLSLVMTACGDPEQKFEIIVLDENGKTMADVECLAVFYRQKQKGGPGLKSYTVKGTTNKQGQVGLSGETAFFNTTVVAKKQGYYDCRIDKMWMTGRNADGNRWEPWPVKVNLIMKKIKNPKPMYVVKFDGQKWLNFPNKQLGPFGFDLMAGDWVHPHGKGKISDFILEGKKDDPEDSTINPKARVLLSFSNSNDGILNMHDQGNSISVGPSIAPLEGYRNQWEFVNWKPHPKEPNLIDWDFREEVFIFRVRTKVDESGNIKNAYYGKIDGRILGRMSPAAPRILMTYYFNKSSNDRGLEWDLKNNLIRDTSRMRVPERP